ncbi:hypothetical protein [Aestuariicoccus sp. MJ-SS9]|uniref:hypothetical protein n=1 Tax=Aestuariicoccus sp. MJ-SS9 TaxID=3079855 RepID=UPI00290F7954|nr:hypothetical protein [Aestuariicoccus sp. MJ-SS9]MDU8912147.1 hypothetical protein [Aestuariicoccus sp. MJ-SS9]
MIKDFQDGIDTLRLASLPGQGQAAKFAQLQISDGAAGAEIAWGGHVIVLEGVNAAAIGPDDMVLT